MINRNSYLSLLESVQEAVAPATVVAAKGSVRRTRRSSATQSSPAAGQNVQWGDRSIGGAMNATELAQWLNSQSGGMAVGSGDSVTPSTSSAPKRVVSRRTAKPKPSTTAGVYETKFDIIDQILAEGLELYGEEGLEEILADFEETGELSEELLDLISETDSLWLSRSGEKKVAKKKA